MRSAPSPADAAMLAQLAEEDLTATPTQLERWRGLGLLPRAHVVRTGFGGSQVAAHDPQTIEAAALLSVVSRRGVPWQYPALHLFDAGFPLATRAVRGAGVFLVERQAAPLRRAWRRAEAETGPKPDPDDELTAVAERAARLLGRGVRALVREEVRLARPTLSARDLADAGERALIWRMADLFAPLRLSEEQRNLARHGTEEPMDPLAWIGVLPLPRERETCARTITWAEASVLRPLAEEAVREAGTSDREFLLGPTMWMLTQRRSQVDFDALDRPLTTGELQRIAVEFAVEHQEPDGAENAAQDGGTVRASTQTPASSD